MSDTTHIISTTEVAERIIDYLNDFQTDNLITGAQFRSKSSYKNVMRAINHADREVCLNLTVNRSVVVYVPADTSSIPFSLNKLFTGNIQQAISALGLTSPNNQYFVQKFDYINVLEITDRYIAVHDSYPVGQESSATSIRKVSTDEFFKNTVEREGRYFLHYGRRAYGYAPDEKICTFIVGENRLILAESFEQEKFLRFMARIQAGIMNVAEIKKSCVTNNDYSPYKIVAPGFAMEYLIEEATFRLLPKSSINAKQIANIDRQEKKTEAVALQPSDRNVIVPHHSFG